MNVKTVERNCVTCSKPLPAGYEFFSCEECRQSLLPSQSTVVCTIDSPAVDDFEFLRFLDGR